MIYVNYIVLLLLNTDSYFHISYTFPHITIENNYMRYVAEIFPI